MGLLHTVMKKSLLSVLLLAFCILSGQVNYPKQNIELISLVTPNFGVGSIDGRLYSGCWGWKQESKNREYAISGASNGTYFIDVTAPASPTVCDYVAGRLASTWREMKTYQNYCYIVSDDIGTNRFQIVDMQYLPDSVHVVYDGTQYFERAHTIFIDKDKLYIGSASYSVGFSAMNIYSLITPAEPVLLRELAADIPSNIIGLVHDMYVRNDTIYASCGNGGLYVLRYDEPTNTIIQLGSFTGYAGAGYNHSSWLTQDGKHLIFCDEVPSTLPIHYVNVENLNNIQPVQTWKPYPNTTSHNPYIIGNDFAIVSCYQDGLMIYDISQPGNVALSGYFDTHPQGGFSTGDYGDNAFRGNWGAYPYLPSGIIIAQDMQNGVFILDGTKAFANRVGISNVKDDATDFTIFPNPAADKINIKYKGDHPATLSLKNMLGQTVFEKKSGPMVDEQLNARYFENGTYIISIQHNGHIKHKKLIVNH